MDYIKKTIFVYNSNPQKYIDSTRNMVPYDWVDRVTNLVSTGRVLDAGCAYGRDAAEYSERGYEVVGIDLSDELLKKAREKYPDIEFAVMDVRQLKYPSESFDIVWCNAVLLHLTDVDAERVLGEFNRVLRPGGVLFVSVQEGEGTEQKTESDDESTFYNFYTKGELVDMLKKAGFDSRNTQRVNENTEFHTGHDVNWIYSVSVKHTNHHKKGGDI